MEWNFNNILMILNESIKELYPESTKYLVASTDLKQMYGPLYRYEVKIYSVTRIDRISEVAITVQQVIRRLPYHTEEEFTIAKHTVIQEALKLLNKELLKDDEFKIKYYGIK